MAQPFMSPKSTARTSADGDSSRLDRWLFSARWFKTRAEAAQSISQGRVQLLNCQVKPAKRVRCGDTLTIRRGQESFEITVMALSERRLPAAEARMLYEETERSLRQRQADSAERDLLALSYPVPAGRPDKRERRQQARLRRQIPVLDGSAD